MTAPTLAGALCAQVDPTLWFPEKGESNTAAKKICHRCDIEAACLTIALADPELEGVWGGTSHRERQTMRALATHRVRPIKHGTPSGYRTHTRRGEDICELCRDARAAARQHRSAGQVGGAT